MKINNIEIKNAFPSKRKIRRQREKALKKGKAIQPNVSNETLKLLVNSSPNHNNIVSCLK